MLQGVLWLAMIHVAAQNEKNDRDEGVSMIYVYEGNSIPSGRFYR